MIDSLREYDVTWTTPSGGASGSMPIGNGDVAANVWVDDGGDVLLLLAKSDSWDENSTLLKLGRLRIQISPKSYSPGGDFLQQLRVAEGDIQIAMGAGDERVTLSVRVDANSPVVVVDIASQKPTHVRVVVESWRRAPYTIKTQTGDLFKKLDGPDPYPTTVTPDLFLTDKKSIHKDAIAWCHHNVRRDPDPYVVNLTLQGLGAMREKQPHPLLGRTFGARVAGEGFFRSNDQTLESQKASLRHRIEAVALTMHPAAVDEWATCIEALAVEVSSKSALVCEAAHRAWWAAFWERSFIFATASTKRVAADAKLATRGYVLQRYMNACASRGAFPLKFNGSLFSHGTDADPDFRRWGGPGFWFQNERLVYWPMLTDGDFDLFAPFARMYLNQLPLQTHRTQKYYGHAGAHYPETITFWGTEVSGHYGWTPFEQRATPEAECSYVTHYYTCGIELLLMLFEWFSHAGERRIVDEFLLPIADGVLTFFGTHYSRDAVGKICFEPAQALETWQDATNPLPEIAGLRYLLPKLLSLGEPALGADRQNQWSRLLADLPPIPTGLNQGLPVVLPAQRFDELKNTENPELYCVFPFRLYGLGKPDLQRAWNTFAARRHVEHTCWHQDDLQAALLGLTGTATANLLRRAGDASHSDSRFPAFWNAHHDWMPDADHGGVLQLTMQAMLLQCEGPRILLLPAWPEKWDVDFKLHAPHQTTITASVRGGRLMSLQVEPADRLADVELCEPFESAVDGVSRFNRNSGTM